MASLSSRIYNRFLTGGILALRPDHIRVANGYSNKFFGWGAEDDDFTLRMFSNQMCIMRPGDGDKSNAPPFIMLAHQASKQNSNRLKLLSDSMDNAFTDGLNNIESVSVIKKNATFKTFTYLLVSVL